MKFKVLIFIFLLFSSAQSLDIQCQFQNDQFDTIGNVYSCTVQVRLGITSPNTLIDQIIGNHKIGSNNDNVLGFTAHDRGLQYIPKNLAEKFKNLVAMRIKNGRLKEVHKENFMKLTKLRYLNLDLNDIEVLDEDLFEGNTMLEVIWFEGNKIKSVDGGVFDKLTKLKDLDLNGNSCISSRVTSRYEVPSFLTKVKNLCYNSETKIRGLKQKVNKLELEITELKAEVEKLEEKLEVKNFENHELKAKVESNLEILSENQNLKVESSKFKIELEKANETISEKSKEVGLVKQDLLAETQKSSKLKQEVAKIDEIYKITEKKLENLEEMLENTKSEIKKLLEENSELKNKTNDQNHEILELNSEVFNLTEENSQNFIKIQDLSTQISHFDAEKSNLKNQIEKLENQTKLQANHEANFNSLSQNFSKISQENSELTSENQKLSSNLLETTKNNSKLQTDIEILSTKIAILTELTSSLSSINDTNEVLRVENAMLTSKVNESETTSNVILYVIVPVVAFVTLINALVAILCYRRKKEIKCELKNDDIIMKECDEDEDGMK